MYNIYETITNVVVYSKVVPAILKIKPKEMRTTKMKDEIINMKLYKEKEYTKLTKKVNDLYQEWYNSQDKKNKSVVTYKMFQVNNKIDLILNERKRIKREAKKLGDKNENK